jgi:hypothetical protein
LPRSDSWVFWLAQWHGLGFAECPTFVSFVVPRAEGSDTKHIRTCLALSRSLLKWIGKRRSTLNLPNHQQQWANHPLESYSRCRPSQSGTENASARDHSTIWLGFIPSPKVTVTIVRRLEQNYRLPSKHLDKTRICGSR